LCAKVISEDTVVDELIQRAESGQHVLWIRNTVIEAQNSFSALRGRIAEGDVRLGLLHSRFPFIRRQELETDWLERLGRHRTPGGPGSILMATQIVEQSVDIDLDFMVSDLAPTDMLFQRLGRLWRHDRPASQRGAAEPEFWVRLPDFDPETGSLDLKRALGRSARVYAPYVLLRSAKVWSDRSEIQLPNDIRTMLEATYADSNPDEPDEWRHLLKELEDEKRTLQANAEAAMLVFGRPMLDPENDGALTRRKGPATVPLLVVRTINPLTSRTSWVLTAPDDSTVTVSDFEWSLAAARFLHHWLVRVPKYQVPSEAPCPRWLAEHVGHNAVVARLETDGQLRFGDVLGPISYHPDFGVFANRPAKTRPEPEPWSDDDDEFDP
jgi:CRISPR-associated endonuclease/helicase Cas3